MLDTSHLRTPKRLLSGPLFTPDASPENVATGLERYRLGQERVGDDFNKLKSIKTKIVAKLEETTAAMGAAQVDGKTNTAHYEQEIFKLSWDLETLDAQIKVSERSVAMVDELAEAIAKMCVGSTSQLRLEMLAVREKVRQVIPDINKTAYLVTTFGSEYMEWVRY